MKTELKNTYEDLIQEMIIDGINGMTPEMKLLIQNASLEKRRSMILTVLEENNVEHRLLCNKIQQTVNTDNHSEMNHIKIKNSLFYISIYWQKELMLVDSLV